MKKSKNILIIFLLMMIGLFQVSSLVSATTTTVIFKPMDDTMIKNDNPNAQSGYSMDMAVRNAYGENGQNFNEINSLINFDIFSIPASATILTALIHLYYYNWSGTDPGGRNLTLYSIQNSWSEEYVNWKTQPSYSITPSSSSFIPNTKGQWMTWDVTNDIQSLIQKRAYYGWKIADESNWKQPNLPMTYFRTKEYTDYTPYLEITYIISEANKAPIAGFSFTPFDPTTKDSIRLTDSSYDPDGTITGWFWNFGDGNSSTIQTPTHTYSQSGQYTISLQVTDNDGLTNSVTTIISIPTMKSTPGFEFLVVAGAGAITFSLLVKFKGKKQ
jgi:hypothetical protein